MVNLVFFYQSTLETYCLFVTDILKSIFLKKYIDSNLTEFFNLSPFNNQWA